MNRRYLPRLGTVALVLLLVGACASPRATAPRITHERLHGVLWVQNAAEFRMAAEQTYLLARDRLDEALRDPSWTAALEQDNQFSGLPPAVIVDIDETVLDNSAFQAQLVKNGVDYDPSMWTRWIALRQALQMPGAASFLNYARSKGVRVFYITGRKEAEEADTRRNLASAGLPVDNDPDTVLTRGEHGSTTSDKTVLRRWVAQTYRIVLLLGDDLNDFVSGASAPPEKRIELAMKYQAFWGRRWIILPNALYGSWEMSLYPSGQSDEETLKRKYELLRGFE